MKKIFKEFSLIGLTFMGFGPLIYALVMIIITLCGVNTICNGIDIFKAVISTSIMAFLVSGVSVVWRIEKLGLSLATLIHFITLYFSYLLVYLLNNWIPKDILVIGIFTIVFLIVYFVIWLASYFLQKKTAKELNDKLNQK